MRRLLRERNGRRGRGGRRSSYYEPPAAVEAKGISADAKAPRRQPFIAAGRHFSF